MSPRQYIELFHLLFLEQLSQKLDKNLFILKGGCNLRFFHKSVRYSENIDLDIHTIAKQTLQNKIRRIFNAEPFKQILAIHDVQIINVTEPKQTETTQRWKLQLQTQTSSLPLPTKIEFSRRHLVETTNLALVDPLLIKTYHLTPIYINHYNANDAFIQKINALIHRTETQARDIFDLFHLLNFIDPITLPDSVLSELDKAKENVLSISFQEFKSQVISYILPEYKSQFDQQNIWEHMVLAVLEHLGKLCV